MNRRVIFRKQKLPRYDYAFLSSYVIFVNLSRVFFLFEVTYNFVRDPLSRGIRGRLCDEFYTNRENRAPPG